MKSGQYFKDKRNRESLDKLEKIIPKKYGTKSSKNCVNIIQFYRNSKILGQIFIDSLLKELGRISSKINVTYAY